MNCSNCAAPLTLSANGGSFVCTYCNSHRIVSDDLVNADGILDMQQPGEHDCPACAQMLNKSVMDEQEVEHCPQCRGVLLTGDLFRQIVIHRRRNYEGADDRAQPVDTHQLGVKRDCPVCHARMDTHAYYGPGNTVIDSCSRCDIIWLDAGETTALVRAPGYR